MYRKYRPWMHITRITRGRGQDKYKRLQDNACLTFDEQVCLYFCILFGFFFYFILFLFVQKGFVCVSKRYRCIQTFLTCFRCCRKKVDLSQTNRFFMFACYLRFDIVGIFLEYLINVKESTDIL